MRSAGSAGFAHVVNYAARGRCCHGSPVGGRIAYFPARAARLESGPRDRYGKRRGPWSRHPRTAGDRVFLHQRKRSVVVGNPASRADRVRDG